MVSAISLCLLATVVAAASSQLLSSEVESSDVPVSERRTFKHGKPAKFLPLVKKHKKFGGLVPHVFVKPSYALTPTVQEVPRPLYKFHRYQGIEVKPISDVSISTPEPIIETHSVEPISDYVPSISSDHAFSGPFQPYNFLLYPVNDKSVFSAPVFTSLPPPPSSKSIFSFAPAIPQPAFSSIPITSIQSPISLTRPAPGPIVSQVPPFQISVFTSTPASVSSRPSQPIFSSTPIKIQPPVLPSLPTPLPAPVLPPVSAPSPAPVLPSVPVPLTPAVFPTVSITPPPLGHAFPSIPSSSFSAVPAPSPSPIPPFSTLSSPAPALSSISIPSSTKPDLPYPPSGTPIPSYVKDISLGDIEIKDSPLPTLETPKYEEVTPNVNENFKNLHNVLAVINSDEGFLQKLKGWKADKANAALSHFSHFKQKPSIHSIPISHFPNKSPLEIPPPQNPVLPPLQFPSPIQPLPLAPAQAPFLFPPSPQFFPRTKYENFPPNNIEPPPLFNSYGVPIPHDSNIPAHASHDRLSSAASEEEPTVVPAPAKKDQTPAPKSELQQQPPAQLLQEYLTQNFQTQFRPQSISYDHPIYVPEENKTVNEESHTTEEAHPQVDDHNAPKEPNSEGGASDTHSYDNHKESS